MLWDPKTPANVKAIALRSLRPDHPSMKTLRLASLFATSDRELVAEIVRTLALRTDEESHDILRTIAVDARPDPSMRLDAIAGLAGSAHGSEKSRAALCGLLKSPSARVQAEAVRSLRTAATMPEVETALLEAAKAAVAANPPADSDLAEQLWLVLRASKHPAAAALVGDLARIAGPRPRSAQEWLKVASEPGGDFEAGRRTMFHAGGAKCFTCHRVSGRGGVGGPELTTIGRSVTRERIHESILAPSKEIAPQYVLWAFEMTDARVFTGVILSEDGLGNVAIVDNQGRRIELKAAEIAERRAQKTSLMPDNLIDLMTRREFRDLTTFLAESK
jgi:putative heme-binding domain-containing protein